MKSKFLRILAMILIISSLISMFAIFASAETEGELEDEETEEEESLFKLLYSRTYDEGWSVKNGFDMGNQVSETTFEIEYEMTFDFNYNYFWRLEVGAPDNSFAQLDFGGQNRVGTVLEFDVKTDDITNMDNVINFGTQGTDSNSRTDYNLMHIADNKVYFMHASPDYKDFVDPENPVFTEPAFTLGNTWMTVKAVFDYEYEHYPIDLENDSEEVILEKQSKNLQWFQLYIYYGPADGSEELTLWTGAPLVLYGGNGKGLQIVRFQASGAKEADYGTSTCFDNIKAYTGVNKLVEITPEMGYGTEIDPFFAITETILGGGIGATAGAFESALAMKIGVDYCSMNSTRRAIATTEDGTVYGAPVNINGNTMISLYALLEYLGYPYYLHPDGVYLDVSTGLSATYLVIGKDTATVGGETVKLNVAPGYVTDSDGNSYLAVSLTDVEKLFPGYYGDYDEMGFISVSSMPNLLDRRVNLNAMLTCMKKFVFDYATGDEIYEDVKENTNNFEHPYLLGSSDKINDLYEEYQMLNAKAEKDELVEGSEEYWLWVHYERIISSGNSSYNRYALKDENDTYNTYVGLSGDENRLAGESLAQPYLDSSHHANDTGDGYDVGGRSDIQNRTQHLERMAYAYVLTHDVKYLQCAYDISVILGTWTHWGPGHFLNCADSSNDFAVYFDLTYQGYKQLEAEGAKRYDGTGYDTDLLASILFNQGVHEGYLSTFTKNTDHLSHVVGVGGCYYSERENNWHAVCVGGMTAAVLAVMGECDGAFYTECTELIADNLESLITYGLDIYAPDGAYIEGPGYWNYGTNNFFRMCVMLDNAAGTNYGLMDTWGIDKTCYYASHSESSDGRTFNFHDGSMSQQDNSYFFYVAQHYNDVTLYDVRLTQINGNLKWAQFIDLLYYPRDIDMDSTDVQLDYYTSQIDLFATRSGWEGGSLYAAMIGGINKLPHGQIDAGDFVYHNGGNVWVIDLGTENYNCQGFWPDATRYRFYVMKPEGNNTLAISTDPVGVPYGQVLTAEAYAIDYNSNEYGAYVVYNMQDTFGARATSWYRGMMLTNDRKTTIVQDQLTLDNMQTVWWFAHYHTGYVERVEISADGRTAYMQQYIGKDESGYKMYQTLRLSIVSNNKTFKFQQMDCYTFIHNDKNANGEYINPNYTYEKGYIATQGLGVPENDRSNYGKLAICSGATVDFNVAVVMELIDTATMGLSSEIDIGYEFKDMRTWTPTADMRGQEIEEEDDVIQRRGRPDVNMHLALSMAKADMLVSQGTAYTTRVSEFYRALTDAHYVVRILGTDLPRGYETQKAALQTHKAAFAEYRKEVNRLADAQIQFVYKLMGMT